MLEETDRHTDSDGTMNEYNKQVQNENSKMHNWMLHWELFKILNLDPRDKCYMYRLESVMKLHKQNSLVVLVV